MSNIIVESFGYFGFGTNAPEITALQAAMLSGTYAQVDSQTGITTLPWDATNLDPYMVTYQGSANRRVLPSAKTVCMASFHYALSFLPILNNKQRVIDFRDAANTIYCTLRVETTGVLALYDKDNVLLVQTAAPLIVSQTDTFLEMKIDVITVTSAVFVCYMNDGAAPIISATVDMNGSSLPHPSGGVAQVALGGGTAGPGANASYMAHLIIRDTAGTYNNTFPIGDRRVATLVVNADDVASQGWSARPRLRFGTGILDNRAVNDTAFGAPHYNQGVSAAASASFYLGNGDFTIETQVRFTSLPSAAHKSQIFGLWDETNNKRSYQLYIGGPTLESGNTVFRISTDGTAATVSEVFYWPWVPETGRWYHVAVVRASGETLFFIDGVQQGLQAADANTYFAASAPPGLGVQNDGGNIISNTSVDGFFDEFRLSVGYARYTTNFTPPIAAYPRGGGDAHWASVVWLSGFDTGVFDESSYARTLTKYNGSAAITPDDGVFNYQCLTPDVSGGPRDDTFVEAAYLPATSILTQPALPTTTKTVTVGTYDVSNTTAVYTWKTVLSGAAFEVLIGATPQASLSNLAAAINLGPGIGTLYGTGTLANNDVTATLLPLDQMEVTANLAGTGGNAIGTLTNDGNGSWTGATLAGGVNIPGYSQFYFKRPPNNTTIVDSVTIVTRTSKTDNGTCNVKASFVGASGGVNLGANNAITTVPTYYQDTFETDPDTAAGLTPATIVGGRVRLNRTA